VVVVSRNLVYKLVEEHEDLKKALEMLESDQRVQTLLRMANIMAVSRLLYNDHGPVHSRIVSGAALYIHKLLEGRAEFSSVKDEGLSLADSKLIVLFGAYLHDIGNSVHRINHYIHGCTLAASILDDMLGRLYEDLEKVQMMKSEILHAIFAHDERVQALSIEAGIVKVADGLDMAEGRARVPYRTGKIDIHSVSAIAIQKVEVSEGDIAKPVHIKVHMSNPAGVFQVEHVFGKKLLTSGIQDLVRVFVVEDGKEKEIKFVKGMVKLKKQ